MHRKPQSADKAAALNSVQSELKQSKEKEDAKVDKPQASEVDKVTKPEDKD